MGIKQAQLNEKNKKPMLFVKSKGRNTLNIGLTFMNLFSFFLFFFFL